MTTIVFIIASLNVFLFVSYQDINITIYHGRARLSFSFEESVLYT